MSRSSEFLVSYPSSNEVNSKHVSVEGEFLKSREFLDPDLFSSQQNQCQQGSGLARYRSAPSSFLGALLDASADNNSSGDESDAFFSALMDGPRDLNLKGGYGQMQYPMKQEADSETPPVQNGSTNGYVGNGTVVGMETSVHGSRSYSSSNLVRQSSSPAGFSNGFTVMVEVGNYRVHNHGEANLSPGDLNNKGTFSSGPSSSLRFMPSIPENANENLVASSTETSRMRNDSGAASRDYNKAAFPQQESPFNSLKRNRDSDMNVFSNFNVENQNEDSRKRSSGLVHHLSLPNTVGKLAVVEKYLHFQPETTVPCQMRAKRGCATHPRSIAERMRRTRISEKMKKLQDLFPTMDKQTSTADMLDLAVEYIKDLQKQVQVLTDTKAKCVCSSKPQ